MLRWLLPAVGLGVGCGAIMAEKRARAGSCDAYAFAYELVEVRLVDGPGDPATQTLWAHEAHLRPFDNGRANFVVFTDEAPEGQLLRLGQDEQ